MPVAWAVLGLVLSVALAGITAFFTRRSEASLVKELEQQHLLQVLIKGQTQTNEYLRRLHEMISELIHETRKVNR